MMQIDGTNTQALLQQLLRTAGTTADPHQYLPTILQTIGQIVGTTRAYGVLFTEPVTVVHIGAQDGEGLPLVSLAALVDSLPSGFQRNPTLSDGRPLFDTDYLIAPLKSGETAAPLGALGFLSPTSLDCLSDEDHALLDSVLACCTLAVVRTRALEQQERAEQLTGSILRGITDPLFVLDQNMRVLHLNPAAEREFKIESAQARGRPLEEIVRSDELMHLAGGKNKNMAEWVAPDNKTFVPRTEPILDPDGQSEGWILTLRDVTHFKKLVRNQHEFTRIVSHDLRSPLTSMQGFASMLELGLVGDLNEKQAHFVEKILSGITQMTALVENITDAGRYDPETGFYELSRSQCDLKEMVNRIIENHLVPAEKQELQLAWNVADNVPLINVDAHMLERALTNLIDNAIKYTPNGRSVSVDIETQDEKVIIGVSDSGYGISPENQKHLFERHVRIPRKEHRKIKGSGLGLFIVRSVAQRHGGDAWVRSEDGQGSTFYMSIPLEGANLIGADGDQ